MTDAACDAYGQAAVAIAEVAPPARAAMLLNDAAELRGVAGFWYVGTPYTDYAGGMEAAFRLAAAATAVLTAHEIDCYSPIAHCHPVALHGGLDPRDGGFWMRRTEPIRRAACGLIVVEMRGWGESRGLTAERQEFHIEGKPIYHLNRVALAALVKGLAER